MMTYIINKFANTAFTTGLGRQENIDIRIFERALIDTHGVIDSITKNIPIDIFSILGMRNLSAFIGEIFARSLAKESNGRFIGNPHQDGYPDLLLMNDDGVRAYELARQGHDIELNKCKMNIYNTKFISYRHPFITFETTVSEGSYIRSFAQILLEKLNRVGTLSYLERINEGAFFFDNEKDLDPLDYIDLPINNYFGTVDWLNTGKKISVDYLEKKENGKYLIITDKFFSIIEIEEGDVKYLLNKVLKV